MYWGPSADGVIRLAVGECGLCNKLFEDIALTESMRMSAREKQALAAQGLSTRELVYGEVQFWSFARVLELANAASGEK